MNQLLLLSTLSLHQVFPKQWLGPATYLRAAGGEGALIHTAERFLTFSAVFCLL